MAEPLEASVVPFRPTLVNDGGNKALRLELSTAQPLVNYALENYAHSPSPFAF